MTEACDVLMLNPPWVSKDDNIWHGIKSAMPPLGLLSVAAFVESKGHRVAVMDIHVEKWSAAEVGERVRRASPRVVGVSVVTATANASHRLARIVKRECPDCLVVFGGVHAEALPTETLRDAAVDVVVRGDGEETLLALVEGQPLERILGISYRRGAEVCHNTAAPVEMDLDRYPFPAYHLAPMEKYYPAIGAYKRLPAINMLMTRGCPGKCIFCNSAETALRARSAEHMVAEIEHLQERYGIREIQFYDDTFTVLKQNVFRFCELIVERGIDISWAAFVRADCFSEQMATAMKGAGCHQVLIGVEAADDEILRNIGKPIDRERTAAAIGWARAAGIDARAAFIFGNVGETLETMQRTLDFSIELDPDIALYNICTPYPGTQMFKWASDNGYLASTEWSDYELSTLLVDLPTISQREVMDFYQAAHRRFYLRPIAIWRRLARITSPSQLKDLIHAFFYIVLRHKLGSRGDVRRDWVGFSKEDFYDFDLDADKGPLITSDLRRPDNELAPERLIRSSAG